MKSIAVCHPSRNVYRENAANRCRECSQVLPGAPDDLLPARIAGTVQRAGPEVPPACRKCGGLWLEHGAYVACFSCGATWHRTSTRILWPPRDTARLEQAAMALIGRKDRRR